MRSVRLTQFGEPAAVLSVEELPVPTPGPGEILIRIRARSINPSDLYMVRGTYGSLPKLPATPGFEGAGSVEAVGADVTTLTIGQSVVPLSGATWQEYVVTAASNVIPLPPGLTDEQAAMLLVNPPTAWLMLHELLQVQPGEWILQTAGNSAVGQLVIELARRHGARTISIVRRRDAVQPLLDLGGDAVLCAADDDIPARVRELVGKSGVPYVLDAVGGELGSLAAGQIGRGGHMIVYGALDGQPLALQTGALIFKEFQVSGFWFAAWLRRASPEAQARLWAGLLPLIHDGTLHAAIEARYDLGEIVAAVRHAEAPGRNGKILLLG